MRFIGSTHMFSLPQDTKFRFDSGLHYTVPYSQHLLWAAAGGSTAPVQFDSLSEEDGCFDKILVGPDQKLEDCFRVKHKEAHMPDLYKKFPENKAGQIMIYP